MQMFATTLSKPCCKNPKNLFCFVCGLYILSHHKRSIMTRPLLEAYEAHFKVRTSKENYLQGPPSVCNVCNNALLRWKNGMCPKPELPFGIPMLWSPPTDHETDCYFCLTRTAPSSVKKNARLAQSVAPIEYPMLRSAVRPKLFTTRPPPVPQAPQSRSTITPSAVANEKDNNAAILIRTYPGQIKMQNPASVAPVVRRSLPVPKTVSSGQTNPAVVSTSTLKRKVDSDQCITYGITKVRLRNSEPTIVLEKCKKLLPMNPSAIIRRPATPSSLNAPRILNVFSLNKDAANCETNTSAPTVVKVAQEPTVKVEAVEDGEEETVPPKLMKMQPPNGEPLKAVTVKQESTVTQPTVVQQPEVKMIKIEPGNSSPPGQKIQQIAPAKVSFINVKDLPSISNGKTTFKITPSLIARQSTDIASASKAVPAASKQTNTAAADQEQKPKPVTPGRYCFINMKDLPSTSAGNNEKIVKLSSAIVQQPAETAEQAEPNATTASGSKVTADQDDIPHRITQSELILLLRELELPREKSAILIDRLKRWNLLAIEMVGTNRARSLEPTTSIQLTPVTTVSPVATSAAAAAAASPPVQTPAPAASPPSTQSHTQPSQLETVNSLINVKTIQLRNTRAANRQSAPPVIMTNPINRNKTSTVSKQDNGGKSDSQVVVVVKGEQSWPQRRQFATAGAVKEPSVLTQRGKVTTRSAASAISSAKQNVTIPRVK